MKIWISGGSRGIGFETAKILSKNHNVIISSRSQPSNLNEGISYISADFSNVASIINAYNEVKSLFGKLDVFINNAGSYLVKSSEEVSEKEFDDVFNVNTKGAFFAIQACLPDMLKNKFGIIFNINSIAAEKTFPNAGIYSGSKAALLSISSSLREEVRDKGIDVIDILPGATSTTLWDSESREEFKHKMIKPQEIGEFINSLLNTVKSGSLLPEKLIIRPKLGDI